MNIIGKRVILQTLLREGKFPGVIIDTYFGGSYVVKLDSQKEPVAGVLYYPNGPPEIINSNLWQFCYPENRKTYEP